MVVLIMSSWSKPGHLGSVYTRPDSFGTGTKLERISLVFTRDMVVPNGSSHEVDPIWKRTILVLNRSRINRVDPYQYGSDPEQI